MGALDSITATELRDLLGYDPETGVFRWKESRGSRAVVGAEVGSDDLYGYKTVRLNKKSYKLHRLAWLHVYGAWPSGDIDHINGTRSDNRIANLRDVPRKVNLENQRNAQNNQSTGILGVYFDKRKKVFYSRISMNNKSIHLGSYPTAEQAQDAYLTAKRQMHAGCTI
jgi:hypothetical protein